jgi:hypothetical protein
MYRGQVSLEVNHIQERYMALTRKIPHPEPWSNEYREMFPQT